MQDLPDPKLPAVRLFASIFAIAPAALFVFVWKWLNSEFPPYLSSGFNSTLESLLAGVWFWSRTVSGAEEYIANSTTDGLLKSQMQQAYWRIITAALAIPMGRIVFSVIPPWNNGIGALIAVALGNILVLPHLLNVRNKRFVHTRGTTLLSEKEARKEIAALRSPGEPQIRWAGFEVSGAIAEGNLLTVGAVGTGKTRMHRECLSSLLPNVRPAGDRRILIYDVKCDLLTELDAMKPSSKVIVFNPFDLRSVAWDIAGDVRTPTQARQFAKALILPEKGDHVFFSKAARAIVSGLIEVLNEHRPGDWSLRHLVHLTGEIERLKKALAKTDLITRYSNPRDTFDNIINTIANAMDDLKPVAALWEHTKQKISLRTWVKEGDSILVLAGRENQQASLQTINRVVIDTIATDFSSEPESPIRSRLWFFCDELKTAGRLEALTTLQNCRSKGVRCVLGFQDLEGLKNAYHTIEEAKEVVNRCASITWLRLTCDKTARWAAERSGEFERWEYLDTKTRDGTSVGEHLAKRESLLASQFLHLPFFKDGNVTGIHLLKDLSGIFKSTAHYEHHRSHAGDFYPRPDVEQDLKPWCDEDEEWFAWKTPPLDSDGSGLSGFGRIDL